MDPLVAMTGVGKRYPGPPAVQALTSVDLSVSENETVAVVGRSGSGKSTLLNLLGLIDVATSGQHRCFGHAVQEMRRTDLDLQRRQNIGFVFQAFHVVPHKTVWENVELKLAILGVPAARRAEMIGSTLARVELDHRSQSFGRLLSGGEKQRLAIARALVGSPRLLLADEPTGNLDDESSGRVLALLRAAAATSGRGLVLITHDQAVARQADRIVTLRDGVLV
jgi:putative ABC transport system ATP-binding protein